MREMEVESASSQLGITVKARFVGALRKGICNFPPLVCTAVDNSYPSPLCLLPFPCPSPSLPSSRLSIPLIPYITGSTLSVCFARGCVVYVKLVVETTQILVCL